MFSGLCNGLFRGAGRGAGMMKGAEVGGQVGAKIGVYATVALFSKRKGSPLKEIIKDCHKVYAELGAPLAEDATLQQVKSAYRTASRKSHPDHAGGSQEAFVKTRMCFEAFTARLNVFAKDMPKDEAPPASEL